MSTLNISERFLLENGFQMRSSDETYYENVLSSSFPQTVLYVYTDAVCIQIGNEGKEKGLHIESEEQLSMFLLTLQDILR